MKTKKGFYFTIIVLFCLILLLLISFQVKREYASEGIKTRILTINNFIKSMERDASRAVYISSYRTMVAALNYVTAKHEYLNGTANGHEITLNGVFADALFNGSLIYSLNYPEAKDLLANASLKDWQERTALLASATNLDLNFSKMAPENLTVTQSDPWNVIISIPIEYNISDSVSGVTWHRSTKINATLPLTNTFEDPLYVIEFGSACGNKIINGDNLKPLVGGPPSCDTTNLTVFLDTPGTGSRYIHSIHSPSYLNRLTGNFSCLRDRLCTTDPNGIESMINILDLGACGMTINPESTIVDFRYDYRTADSRIKGAESWVYLDKNLDFPYYNISSGCAL